MTEPRTLTEDLTLDSDGPLAEPQAPAGAPQLSDYHILGRLGEGGMGVVWRAMQRSTRRQVALKVLSAATVGSERARRRFEREVELAARLEDPRIARVYDAGVENGIAYYAMQLVEGVPLDDFVRDRRLEARAVLALMLSVCEAVQHAHQRGIIHRDLKPSNILVRDEGEPVVLDFGLAKALESPDEKGVSLAGQVAGTPAYMSPEQAGGHDEQIDTRSDVYSLGVILYRLLTGQSPHDLSGSTLEVMRRIAEQEPRRPRQSSRDASRVIDPELETLLLKCLSRDPDRRYDSAGALAQDLGNYLAGEPLLAKRPTATYIIRKRLRRHRVPVAIAAAVGVLMMGGVAWAKFRNAKYVLDSEPVGASIMINGKVKEGCTSTPCFADLPFGRHEIRLAMPGYQDSVRIVEVDWGKARILTSESWTEAVRLAPNSRTFVFTSQPSGAIVAVRNSETGELLEQQPTPCVIEMPIGFYTAQFQKDGYTDPDATQRFQVTGSVKPFVFDRKLKPNDAS